MAPLPHRATEPAGNDQSAESDGAAGETYSPGDPQPTGSPSQPSGDATRPATATTPPTDATTPPTDGLSQPTGSPSQPTGSPNQPSSSPTQPSSSPSQPTDGLSQPGGSPSQPGGSPSHPADGPNRPAGAGPHGPNEAVGSVEGPEDLVVGAFSLSPPWLVDPDKLSWRYGLDTLRAASSAEVPRLLRRSRIPPGRRVVTVGAVLGYAIGTWYLRERRQARREGRREISRAGLSRRLRKAFERLGPTYIKLGQILSSGEGIFPPELVSEFRLLRDRVRPESFDTVKEIVEADLGRRLNEIFTDFATTPLAAASIAQVHAARLVTGEEVVVKVQRPAVSTLVRRDLAAMSWIAPALVGRIPVSALANPPALVELFAETIVEELDFRLEAENMLDVAHVLADTGQRSVVVPRPHPSLVTRRVLVMERLDGFGWDDVEGMHRAGIDTSAVVRALMIAFLEGAMLYGVFHGDLHGGNLFVQPDGKVALLDYGITGRLTEPKRLAFLRLLMGGTVNDPKIQLGALRDLGALPLDTDIDAVIVDMGLDQPLKDPTAMAPDELIAEIREITRRLLDYGARFPKELMLFVKDFLFLDGALATLAPDVDLLQEITDVAGYFAIRYGERIANEVGVDLRQQAVDLEGFKGSIGVAPDVDRLTYRDLQARRELIRKRMEDHHRKR